MKLDGNALAGPLGELFTVDITSALGICDSCGMSSALGAIEVFAGGPALVLRCPACEVVWGYVGRFPDGIRLSLSGVRNLCFPVD